MRSDRARIARLLREVAGSLVAVSPTTRDLRKAVRGVPLDHWDPVADEGAWAISDVLSADESGVKFTIAGIKLFSWKFGEGTSDILAERVVHRATFDDVEVTKHGW